jgi:hypothetical protein
MHLEKLPSLQTVLHDHQRQALAWMIGLHDLEFNGILADEMGMCDCTREADGLLYVFKSRDQLMCLQGWERHSR